MPTLPIRNKKMNEPTDTGTFQWALGIATTIVLSAFGHLHLRLNRAEEAARKEAAEAEEAAREGDREIWAELDKQREASGKFREHVLSQMVTKDDIREMEHRLLTALRPEPEEPRMPRWHFPGL
jgi:hypothetical protein